MQQFFKLLSLIPLGIFLVGCETISSEDQEKIDNANVNLPAYRVRMIDMSREFEENSIVAEDKYMYQPVEIHDLYLSSIDDGYSNDTVDIQLGTIARNFADVFTLGGTYCQVKRSHPAVAVLKTKDNLIVRGVVNSESSGVKLTRCRFYIKRLGNWFPLDTQTQSRQIDETKSDNNSNVAGSIRSNPESNKQQIAAPITRSNRQVSSTTDLNCNRKIRSHGCSYSAYLDANPSMKAWANANPDLASKEKIRLRSID